MLLLLLKAIGLSVGTAAGRFGRSIRVVETTQLGDRRRRNGTAPAWAS
jgi:hypothetical protein